jgi:hypothetical protein
MLRRINRVGLPRDLQEWIELAESGRIYRELAESMNQAGKEMTRDEIKRAVFKSILFGSIPRPGSKGRGVYDVFASRFPTVARFLRRMKQLGPALKSAVGTLGPWLPAKWAKGRPARISQRTESWLIVHVVVPRLLALYPRMPIVTCHDSILTTEPYCNTATSAIAVAFAEIGLHPRISKQGGESDASRRAILQDLER